LTIIRSRELLFGVRDPNFWFARQRIVPFTREVCSTGGKLFMTYNTPLGCTENCFQMCGCNIKPQEFTEARYHIRARYHFAD